MAKAYLGKISALVTANTSDFNSKLNASANEVRSFAKSMQTSLTRAQSEATSALRGIYTESQKVSRALQAVATQRLSFKGFDTAAVGSIRQAVDQFKALQQAAVLVNEPLSRAARAVEKLAAPVQLGFEPALKSAQKSAEYLNSALTRGGIIGEKSFERIERRALAAAQAADRLAEAAQMASAGPRGTELAFAAPRVRDSLAASADVRQRAAAAPASVLEGGRVANDVQKLVAIDNLIQKRRAEIESGTILNIDTTRARASLESLLQIAARVRAQVGEALESANVGAASTVDATGRSIRDRIRDIAALRDAEASLNRERELAANVGASSRLASTVDATGRSIRDRIRDIAALRDAEASLNRERELAANVGARSQRATQLPADYFSGRLASQAADSLGSPLGAATRQLDQFRSGIVSAKSQLDAMPAAVRSHFIPAIQGAEQEFIRLVALGPRATAEEIENAARNMDTLTAAVRRTTQAAQVQSFGDFINDADVRQSIGELQGLQRVLIQVGSVAGGPAARAYEAYRARLQEAISTGTTGLPAVRRELERLQRAAAEAAAATGRISVGNAFRQIQRGGDVARGGFDNFSLAVNQAAFAIDDFFSATGGLEFKLRAVSNNITQLAFILGGTQGLFIGLAAVIGGQVAVAINKWINDGRTAEDQTKALNDALARQKSLVEELAQAFQSLGESLTRNVFSPAASEANDFRKQLDDLIKKQKELREGRVADADQGVQRERANQAALQRRLDSEGNAGVRVGLQRQIEASRVREQEAARRANAGSATRDDVRLALERSLANVGVAQLAPAVDAGSAAARAREADRVRQQASQDARRLSAGDDSQQRAAIEAEIRRLSPVATGGDALGFGVAAAAAKELEQLERVLSTLDATKVVRALDEVAVQLFEGAKPAADAIEAAQSAVAEGIKEGVPAARQFGIAVDQVGVAFQEALRAFEAAARIADPTERQAAQEEAATKLSDATAQAAALKTQTQGITVATSAVQRFAEALDRSRREVEQNLQQAQSNADATRRADLGRSTPDSRKARDAAESQLRDQQAAKVRVEQEIARAREVFGQQAAQFGPTKDRAGRAARMLSAGREFTRIREAAGIERAGGQTDEDVIDEARRRGLDAVADALQKQADIINQGAKTFPTWDDAELAVAEYESTIQSFTGKIASSLDRISQIDKQLASAGVLPQEARDSLIAERAALENSVVEQSAGVKRARDASTQLAEQAASADRGDVLQQTPGERAAKDLEQQIADIRESASRAAENSSGMPEDIEKIRKRMNEAIGRAEEDMIRRVAPMLAGFEQERMNARIPSRAALVAADVSTAQGAQELNRLLRGDDPNKNINFAEMAKQTAELKQINEGIKKVADGLGGVVN
jgi:hypothetical protein